MTSIVRVDNWNRIALSRELRRAAGIARGQRLKVFATAGRIVLEVERNRGHIARRGKLKVWSGPVPPIPIEEAVEQVRHYKSVNHRELAG